MPETLEVTKESHVTTVTLNRPESLNAMNLTLLRELADLLGDLAADAETHCLVLTGSGRGFCTGLDLKETPVDLATAPQGAFRQMVSSYLNPVIRSLFALEKPVIAAVNGPAAGAGLSLALACDLRLASREATFIQAFVNIGLIPDGGSSFLLPRLVGRGTAFEISYLGEPVSAERALELGLVNRVVPSGQLLPEAWSLARRLAAGPGRALALMKRAFNAAAAGDLDAALDLEAELQEEAARTGDFAEALSAFREKRPPRFKGH